MPPHSPDDTSSLERARERLYSKNESPDDGRAPLSVTPPGAVPHEWQDGDLAQYAVHPGKRHVRLAAIFLIVAVAFFAVSLAAAGFLFLYGGNSVSVDKVTIDIQGPTTIAGGDTVPLSLAITNKNPVAIENATFEIDFPDGTRSADNVLAPNPRFSENFGSIPSGATLTRSIKAVIFGGEGQALSLPVSFTYGTSGSNAVFVKKSAYALKISSTPLSVSVDTLAQTVSGKPLTFTLSVRSNATVPLQNVVVAPAFPFGFAVTSSSVPLNDSSFILGTMAPGALKTITLTGTLLGQDKEQRVFHFTVGTAKGPGDPTLAVTYMTQDAAVAIEAPFIDTTLAVNGDTSPMVVVSPGGQQTVTLSYANTLSTSVTNAVVTIGVSGGAVDYNSIRTNNGFYRSADHSVIFSKDTDPALGTLAPGASGIGTFSFATLSSGSVGASPAIQFTISVSGTRQGQTNVPETVTASATKTVKVATVLLVSASSFHTSGAIANSGPIPPRANQATTYTVSWNVQNRGNAVAGGSMQSVLPSYVSYTGMTAGSGAFSYDSSSHTVSWNVGDLASGASAQGSFQVSITPSTSQKGTSPQLTGSASFSGYDRFAGVQVGASVDSVTIETKGDSGYSSANGSVQ